MISGRKLLLIALLCIGAGCGHKLRAQEIHSVRIDSTIMKLNNMTVEDYMSLEIPSLDSLYYNAYRMSHIMELRTADLEYYEREVKTVKKKPLEWVRIMGSYNYGNSDLAAIALMETTYQVWSMSNTSQRSSFYNVGVTLSIPLSELFNTSNRNKQAKARARQAKAQRELDFDDLKLSIVDYYCTVNECISILAAKFKTMKLASGQYSVIENDFVNGKTDASELYRAQEYQASAINEFESIRKDLNKALLSLEIVSCTPIVSK